MRSRMFGAVAFLGALLVGVLMPTVSLPAFQGGEDIEATVAALENRVAGLEARMTAIEKRVAEQGTGASESAASGGVTHSLKGEFVAFVGGTLAGHPEGEPCARGREGLSAGAKIIIHDGSGQVLATAEVQMGAIRHDPPPVPGDKFSVCVLPFEIPNLPDSDFYKISAEGMGGVLTFSREELEEKGWMLSLRFT